MATIEELKKSGKNAIDLKKMGYSAKELRNSGFDLWDLISAGYNAKELKDAGFSAEELKYEKYSAEPLKWAGYSAKELKDAGFKPIDFFIKRLRGTGQYIIAGDNGNFSIESATSVEGIHLFTVAELIEAGYSPVDIKSGQYTAKNFRDAGVKADQLIGVYDLIDLKCGGYTAKEILASKNYPPWIKLDFNALYNAGYSLRELRAAGFSLKDINAATIGLISCTTVKRFKEAGFSANEFKELQYDARTLKTAGYSVKELLDAGYYLRDIMSDPNNRGWTSMTHSVELFQKYGTSIPIDDVVWGIIFDSGIFYQKDKPLLEQFSQACEKIGTPISIDDLIDAGYSKEDLKKTGFTDDEINTDHKK